MSASIKTQNELSAEIVAWLRINGLDDDMHFGHPDELIMTAPQLAKWTEFEKRFNYLQDGVMSETGE